MKRIIIGCAILVTGVGFHMLALFVTDQLIVTFPAVPDLFMDRLPRVEFGVWGELYFLALLTFFFITFSRQHKRDVGKLLILLGVFYALRGVFLLFLPIGIPNNAPPLIERFTFYPYGSHAYFPGGHFGILTLMTLSLQSKRMRWIMFVGVVLFGLGTIFAKTHYTADIIGGGLLAYGVFLWGERRVRRTTSDT